MSSCVILLGLVEKSIKCSLKICCSYLLGSSSGLGRWPFTPEITGSNPVPSTILNCIRLPSQQVIQEFRILDGVSLARLHERWKRSGVLQGCRMMKRIRWSRWNNLASNVVRILSADGAVRNQMEFWIGSKHPSVIQYGIICLVLSRYRYRTL